MKADELESDMTEKYKFTIFTPTYNRKKNLRRLYDSIINQSYPKEDYEWLIVDDQSSDGTQELVREWQAESPVNIRLITQPRKKTGKHRAFNIGIKEAHGKYFTWEDSDDECAKEKLEILEEVWDEIPEAEKSQYAGVLGRSVTPEGDVIGDPLPKQQMSGSFTELKYKLGDIGELSGFIRTKILSEHLFPDIEERFVPEGILWYEISGQYCFKFISEPLTIMHDDGEGRLTTSIQPEEVAKGHAKLNLLKINEHYHYIKRRPWDMMKSCVRYSRFRLHEGSTARDLYTDVDYGLILIVCILTLPVAYILYLIDKVHSKM